MGVFNETIFPLTRVGYEMITANSCPTSARGIIVKYKKSSCFGGFRGVRGTPRAPCLKMRENL